MSNCTQYEPIIAQRYFDGELPTQDAVAFEAHLSTCRACKEAIETWSGIGELLRAELQAPAPPELTEQFTRRARERQLQSSRRIAWSLLAAASLLLVSSLFLVGYSQADQGETPTIMNPWEEYVVASPVVDEEYTELESRTLVAIHIQKAAVRENGND